MQTKYNHRIFKISNDFGKAALKIAMVINGETHDEFFPKLLVVQERGEGHTWQRID